MQKDLISLLEYTANNDNKFVVVTSKLFRWLFAVLNYDKKKKMNVWIWLRKGLVSYGFSSTGVFVTGFLSIFAGLLMTGYNLLIGLGF